MLPLKLTVVGTFAILHRTVGMPTNEEIEAIDLITEHVADAIMWSREMQYLARPHAHQAGKPLLTLVSDNTGSLEPASRLLGLASKLQAKADDLDRLADRSVSHAAAECLRNAAELSRKLGTNIMSQFERRARKPGP